MNFTRNWTHIREIDPCLRHRAIHGSRDSIESAWIEYSVDPAQHAGMIFILRIRQGRQKVRVAMWASHIFRRAGILAGGANG
jgi:hypothetical protein